MTLTLALSLFLAASFPSSSKTSWMSPESFRLTIGMPRHEAVKTLQTSGWSVKPGQGKDELVIDYSDEKSLTLEFRGGRLRSVRFELFAVLADVRAAFAERKAQLIKTYGQPRKTAPSLVVYDDRLPNIMVVLAADPKSAYGQKGVGFLAVRYYDPVSR